MRAILLLVLLACPAGAQMIQGVIRDSIARLSIPGAVVSALDSSGATVARTLSDGQGAFRLVVPGGKYRLRVQRIGFRRLELLGPVTVPVEGAATADVVMVALPSLLETVRVTGAAKCPRRRDNASASALLEQARAGLLATIVARESNPATVVRYRFERFYEPRWPDSAAVSVLIDSTTETTTSFRATRTGAELAQFGFRGRAGDRWEYYGPDADVLLDPDFTNAYCFRIADRDRTRRGQIGLSFAAPDRQKDRVDIVGTLWIDTIARALRDIEFTYTGIGGLADYVKSGGKTSFREMANGSVVVDRWSVRLLKARVDTLPVRGRPKEYRVWPHLVESEGGGFLARAKWSDGTTWTAPMGTARFRLMVDDSTPAVGTEVRLKDTDYRGRTDSAGRVELKGLFPGQYALLVTDTLLASFGFESAPQFSFTIAADGLIEQTTTLRSTAVDLIGRCRAQNPGSPTDLVIVTTVRGPNGGESGVTLDFTVTDPEGKAEDRKLTERTGPNGTMLLCVRRDDLGSAFTVRGRKGDRETNIITAILRDRITAFRLTLLPAPPE
jgi:hypothetical protein